MVSEFFGCILWSESGASLGRVWGEFGASLGRVFRVRFGTFCQWYLDFLGCILCSEVWAKGYSMTTVCSEATIGHTILKTARRGYLDFWGAFSGATLGRIWGEFFGSVLERFSKGIRIFGLHFMERILG